MNTRINSIRGREILDSRGRPTVEVDVVLEDGSRGRASVPSGASTGAAEAYELRDGDLTRYAGYGVLKAVANVNGEIAACLVGADAIDQRAVDASLCQLEGSPRLSRLGANAILGVSLAVARAVTTSQGQLFFQRIAELAGVPLLSLPTPMVNILSGGMHAAQQMDLQDFLAIPLLPGSIAEAIQLIARVRDAATEVSLRRGLPVLLADEGGLSPGLKSRREALCLMVESIECAGLKPGEDIGIAIDAAASTLREDGRLYNLKREGKRWTTQQMIESWVALAREFPIVSIEDALDEEDWAGWRDLTQALGSSMQLVGDDLFATQPARLARGISDGVANSILIKANQNGTLTGTLDVIAQGRAAGYATVVSARSGETEDPFIADLAVGSAAGQIKIGSLRTSNTMAKYNQLLRIEEASGAPRAAFTGISGLGVCDVQAIR